MPLLRRTLFLTLSTSRTAGTAAHLHKITLYRRNRSEYRTRKPRTAGTAVNPVHEKEAGNMPDQNYIALYRKYRPRDFDDVRGRDAIVRTLKIRSYPGGSDTVIFSAERAERARRPLPVFLHVRSTVKTSMTEIPAENAPPAVPLRQRPTSM